MRIRNWAILGIAALAAAGCGDKSGTPETNATTSAGTSAAANSTTAPGEKPLVVFSQANSRDPWRKVFDADTKAAAEAHASEFSFEEQEASDDPSKQNDINNTFLLRNPKVMLVSPAKTSVRPSIEKAFDKGIPVILLDRSIEGDKYTTWIGGDNVEIGREAAGYIVKRLNGKGTVLMIQGIADNTATKDRANGAMEVFNKNPGIKVIAGDDCGYDRTKARNYMQTFLQKGDAFDAVYAHNDEMAIGAYLAMNAAHTPKKIVVGVDGCQQEVINYIKDGKLDATFKYPTPGPKAIEVAAEILKGNMPEKKIVLPTVMVTKETADQYLKDNPNLSK